MTTAKAKKAPAKKPGIEPAAVAEVKLIPLVQIDTLPQVRTEFDDGSIAELAKDIEARGLLQPVLLNPNGDRYTLIAGERRLRAVKLLGMPGIPALITKVSPEDAALMQLAENIQREDLSLSDEAAMVRRLHDVLGTVKAVAEAVKKSSAWVSKRLAVTHPEFSHFSRELMADGMTEDIDLLNVVDQVAKLSYWEAQQLTQTIRAGKADRNKARDVLKEVKAKVDAQLAGATPEEKERRKREADENQKKREEEALAAKKLREEGTGPEFIEWALGELDDMVTEPADDADPQTWLNERSQAQRDTLQSHLARIATDAKAQPYQWWIEALHPWNSKITYVEQLAAVLGLKGLEIDNLYAFVDAIAAENREMPEQETE